jgi:hypothetical protein
MTDPLDVTLLNGGPVGVRRLHRANRYERMVRSEEVERCILNEERERPTLRVVAGTDHQQPKEIEDGKEHTE